MSAELELQLVEPTKSLPEDEIYVWRAMCGTAYSYERMRRCATYDPVAELPDYDCFLEHLKEWENAKTVVDNILLGDDSDGLICHLKFSDIKLPIQYIFDWALCREAYKCVNTLLLLKLDLNHYLPACDGSPLQIAAIRLDPCLVETFIRHGAKTDIGLGIEFQSSDNCGTPITRALTSLRVKLEVQWNREEPVFKLIAILCLPRMRDALKTIQLLVQSTDEVEGMYICPAVEYGNLIEIAILLMVARKKVLKYKLQAFDCGINGETRNDLLDVTDILERNEMGDVYDTKELELDAHNQNDDARAFKAYEQLESSVITLFMVFEKAGDAIERYLKTQCPKVSGEQVTHELAMLLVDAGFNIKPEHVDLSDIYRCVVVRNIKSSSDKATEHIYPRLHIIHSVDTRAEDMVWLFDPPFGYEAFRKGVFRKRTEYGYPDLSLLKPPYYLNSIELVPTGSGLKSVGWCRRLIDSREQLVPKFLPAKKLVQMIKRGIRWL